MYPNQPLIKMDITDRIHVLCGRSRPGHFEGVLTVLTKLFHIVQPNKIYFGLKDAQQVAVVDALITDLNFPIDLVGLSTVRDNSGLAMSSRNINLTKEERDQALWLYKSLKIGQQLIVDGEENHVIIKKEIINTLKQHIDVGIDYVEIHKFPSLHTVSVIIKKKIK